MHTVEVQIGPQGMGRLHVPDHHLRIERVIVQDAHGNPHVVESKTQPGSWIEVLGAIPDTTVIVTYNLS